MNNSYFTRDWIIKGEVRVAHMCKYIQLAKEKVKYDNETECSIQTR
jgi:hypothetical protein